MNNFSYLLKSSWRLKLFFLKSLPMALLSGLKVISASDEQSKVSIPYKYLTKNPFRSMYFACQSMAAEFSTAIITLKALENKEAQFSIIVTAMSASFSKKATGPITFECHKPAELEAIIDKAFAEDEPNEITLQSIGTDTDAEQVAQFSFTWSFKPKS